MTVPSNCGGAALSVAHSGGRCAQRQKTVLLAAGKVRLLHIHLSLRAIGVSRWPDLGLEVGLE